MKRIGLVVGAAMLAAIGVSSASEGQSVQTLGDRIATIEGLAGPESVHWDDEQAIWFISNFNGDAAGDANGFISKASSGGELLEREFMVGTDAHPLHGPRGMRIQGHRLWVADAQGLHAFDRQSGEHAEFIDFSAFEPGFLNDVEIGPDGAIYLTDTGNARLFRIADGKIDIVASSGLTSPPNGVVWVPQYEALVLAPWAGGLEFDGFQPEQQKLVKGPTLPAGGNIDGLEPWQGGLLASSQEDQAIWFVLKDRAEILIRTEGRPADIGLDPAGHRIAVPYIALDRVDIWRLSEPADR